MACQLASDDPVLPLQRIEIWPWHEKPTSFCLFLCLEWQLYPDRTTVPCSAWHAPRKDTVLLSLQFTSSLFPLLSLSSVLSPQRSCSTSINNGERLERYGVPEKLKPRQWASLAPLHAFFQDRKLGAAHFTFIPLFKRWSSYKHRVVLDSLYCSGCLLHHVSWQISVFAPNSTWGNSAVALREECEIQRRREDDRCLENTASFDCELRPTQTLL